MLPLNPFLKSFFASKLPSQCTPASHFVLLVPSTEFLLGQTDSESQTPFASLVQNEDVLSSHILRIPGAHTLGHGQVFQNLREGKAKTKQYSTLNGRTVVVKDAFVYSNKGFKSLVQAQLLTDELLHSDLPDLSRWLIYYISRPLLGSVPAPTQSSSEQGLGSSTVIQPSYGRSSGSGKAVASFSQLLNDFPMIDRQIRPSLQRLYRAFVNSIESPASPPSPSSTATTLENEATDAEEAHESTPTSRSAELERSRSSGGESMTKDELHLRACLEKLVFAVVNLFQSLDKQQLNLVGEETSLTGSDIENLIERHVGSHVHERYLWPRVRALRQAEDHALDGYTKAMSEVDIAQVGISEFADFGGKHELSRRVSAGVTAFKNMGGANSPLAMLDVLLETQRCLTGSSKTHDENDKTRSEEEKVVAPSNFSADALVSLLLMVVIRSPIKRLHARCSYMQDFIFLSDVTSGYAGYAISTFEAVLAYLSSNSRALRSIGRTNQQLWNAVRKGDVASVRALLDPAAADDSDRKAADESTLDDSDDGFTQGLDRSAARGDARPRFVDDPAPLTESNLSHVFPFHDKIPTPANGQERTKNRKRVSMDTRSMSSSSVQSYMSRSSTLAGSVRSLISGETTAEQLCQTEDNEGNSILMMAIESGQVKMLKYLLSLEHLFTLHQVLSDRTKEGTTLLSAAVQQRSRAIVEATLGYLIDHMRHEQELLDYLAAQDSSGRSVAHFCFSAPQLLSSIGHLLAWQQRDKNGQTPLFAVCRSYDSDKYHHLTMSAINTAVRSSTQGGSFELADHVDNKANTLLHIVNDADIIQHLLLHRSSDPNLANERKFTPLMVASKFARLDSMRTLFADARIDLQARDQRGLTAVEVAKDDEVRNRIDDMVLLLAAPDTEGRRTTIARAVLVDDGSVRMIIKSGAPTGSGTVTVTTSRRSLNDFDNLARWLSLEQPASFLPPVSPFRSPFQITPKPSKQVLRDIQLRLNGFLRTLLAHPTFAKHEMLWEFFLVPDMDPQVLAERAKRKAEIRVDNLAEDYAMPLNSAPEIAELDIFTGHAIDQLRHVHTSFRTTIRRLAAIKYTSNNLSEAYKLVSKYFVQSAPFTPETHLQALGATAAAYSQREYSPYTQVLYDFHTSLSTIAALLEALTTRPQSLIAKINTARETLTRCSASLSSPANTTRRSRSPIPLIASLPNRLTNFALDAGPSKEEAAARASEAEQELEMLGRELRYTQTTVAQELAGWQEQHAREVKGTLKTLAKRMVVEEKARLAGMERARRVVVRLAAGREEHSSGAREAAQSGKADSDVERGRVRMRQRH